MEIKAFQKQYGLTNKEMAEVCACSLPTIQKWRSGEVKVSGVAQQLMRLLDLQAEGSARMLSHVLKQMDGSGRGVQPGADGDLKELKENMATVVDRLELMLEGRRKDKELSESEARYCSMVEAFEDPICRWLPDTTLTFVNEAYAKALKREPAELVGRKWLEFVPEDKRATIAAITSDIVRRGEPDGAAHEIIDKDGRRRIQEWRDIPVKDEKGRVVEFHSLGRDVTELLGLKTRIQELETLRDAMMSLCDHPLVTFDEEGTFLDYNGTFQSTILGEQHWKDFTEMVSAFPAGKFKRLLKRLTGSCQLRYRLQIGKRMFCLKSRLLNPGEAGARFLGILELEQVEQPVEPDQRVQLAPALTGKASALRALLKQVAAETRVDRIFYRAYQPDDSACDTLMEWHAPGVPSQFKDLQGVAPEDFKWWTRRMRKNQWVQVDDVRMLPGTAAIESQYLQNCGVRAVLAAPLKEGKRVAGFVGFEQLESSRIWHGQEVTALNAFRDSLLQILGKDSAIPA